MAIGKPSKIAAFTPEEFRGTPADAGIQSVIGGQTEAAANFIPGAEGTEAGAPALAFQEEGGTEQNSVMEAARANTTLATEPGTPAKKAAKRDDGRIVKTDNSTTWTDYWADSPEGQLAARDSIIAGRVVRKLMCQDTKSDFYRIWNA